MSSVRHFAVMVSIALLVLACLMMQISSPSGVSALRQQRLASQQTPTPQVKTVLDDPLSDNSQGNGWDVNDNCQFNNGAYYASIKQTNTSQPCLSQRSFSDFVYGIHMTIVKGDCGGITFRHDSATSTGYVFEVCQDGSYTLYRNDRSSSTLVKLVEGRSSSINQGVGQDNTIVVIAIGDDLSFYMNGAQSPATTFKDSNYSQGAIGVVADSNDNPTSVSFTNAKVLV